MNSKKPPKKWIVELKDCGDGTGDCYIELPEELIKRDGLKIGDTFDLEVKDGCALLMKKTSKN